MICSHLSPRARAWSAILAIPEYAVPHCPSKSDSTPAARVAASPRRATPGSQLAALAYTAASCCSPPAAVAAASPRFSICSSSFLPCAATSLANACLRFPSAMPSSRALVFCPSNCSVKVATALSDLKPCTYHAPDTPTASPMIRPAAIPCNGLRLKRVPAARLPAPRPGRMGHSRSRDG